MKAIDRIGLILWIFLGICFSETLDAFSPPLVEHPMFVVPLWLTAPLMCLSIYGLFLLERLRGVVGGLKN